MRIKNRNESPSLGLDKPITRRDVLHGFGMAGIASVLPAGLGGCTDDAATGSMSVVSGEVSERPAKPVFAPELDPDYYPPAKTGLRGSHAGSFEVAHGQTWNAQTWDNVTELTETYDLIVVGAGLSGLSAAFRYRQRTGADTRILILDNHDDFGGAAKRIEFTYADRTLLAPGGSVFMETPYFSDDCKRLIRDAGVDFKRLEPGQVSDLRLHALNLPPSICFDAAVYGEDKTIVGEVMPLGAKDADGKYVLSKHIDEMPLSAAVKAEISHFLTSDQDVFSDMTAEQRVTAVQTMSYDTFLTEYCGMSREAADAVFTRQTAALMGVATDSAPLHTAITLVGMPGVHRLGDQGRAIQEEVDAMPPLEGHYGPEGNAIIARNLVKRLISEVADAETMEALTTARFNYARLDEARSRVRIRLNSTAINIKTLDTGKVSVSYVRGGDAYRVSGRQCIYAGYHAYLPYLCPQLPAKQKSALSENVRIPFVCAGVALRSGKPIQELGSASFYFPGHYLHECLAYGRSLGAHQQDFDPAQPVVIYMIGPMLQPHTGLHPSEQHRQGRHKLLAMSFQEYEIEIRQQLASVFAQTSFDATEDIVGITVNRWPHGYSRQYNSIYDPKYAKGEAPHEIARRRHGPIAIANSDASYWALANTAIDEGLRAVEDLLAV